MKRSVYFLLITFLFTSCNGSRLNYDKGIIPPVPVNFTSVNSFYDDYNSNLQISWTEMTFSLIFSSNRNSFGDNFDFVSYNGHIMSDLVSGEFEMSTISKPYGLLGSVNTDNNEFGPYFTVDFPDRFPWYREGEERRFFYSSDPDGDLDVFFCVYDLGDGEFTASGDPSPLTQLNTEHNEGYLSILHDALAGIETVYFMSDRDGSYDIYSATGEEGKLISESAAVTITRSADLSSNANDKCPCISGNVMVFASDRTGGFGGYDLWYSVYDSSSWSAPVNLGGDINTEYDEYRPVVVPSGEWFVNDLMIFSSNRPGGKGGFDLFYVGVPKR
jgi:hypothetical protein